MKDALGVELEEGDQVIFINSGYGGSDRFGKGVVLGFSAQKIRVGMAGRVYADPGHTSSGSLKIPEKVMKHEW